MTIIFGVHSVKPDEITATELLCTRQADADVYAKALSADHGVVAGAVTRYVLDEPGRRTPVSLFVDGTRQQVPHLSDNREIAANGYVTHPTMRHRERPRPVHQHGHDHDGHDQRP